MPYVPTFNEIVLLHEEIHEYDLDSADGLKQLVEATTEWVAKLGLMKPVGGSPKRGEEIGNLLRGNPMAEPGAVVASVPVPIKTGGESR